MNDIYQISVGKIYYTKNNKIPVYVTGFSKHAMDCSVSMVHYINLKPTQDNPLHTKWVIEESIFLKRFLEI